MTLWNFPPSIDFGLCVCVCLCVHMCMRACTLMCASVHACIDTSKAMCLHVCRAPKTVPPELLFKDVLDLCHISLIEQFPSC